MDQSVFISLSGAKLQELKLELAANNLANAATSGYKGSVLTSRTFEFDLADAIESGIEIPPGPIRSLEELDEPYPGQQATYTATELVATDFSQGAHKQTGNPLNLALEGPGFLVVETVDGPRYTRQGVFSLNSDGELVTHDGLKVKGTKLDDLGESEVTIDADGEVYLDGVRSGSIEIVEFSNPSVLKKQGSNLYQAAGQTPVKAENTVVKQGFLEESNVNVVRQMVSLIELNRLYETYQRQITTVDQMIDQAIDILIT